MVWGPGRLQHVELTHSLVRRGVWGQAMCLVGGSSKDPHCASFGTLVPSPHRSLPYRFPHQSLSLPYQILLPHSQHLTIRSNQFNHGYNLDNSSNTNRESVAVESGGSHCWGRKRKVVWVSACNVSILLGFSVCDVHFQCLFPAIWIWCVLEEIG